MSKINNTNIIDIDDRIEQLERKYKNVREYRLMELINVMSSEIDNKNIKICDLENEVQIKTEIISRLNEECDKYYNKLKFYEKDNKDAKNSFSEILSKIGRAVPEDFRKQSEQRYERYKKIKQLELNSSQY